MQKISQKKLPDQILNTLSKELKKLSQMKNSNAESHIIRQYIDTILELPWLDYSEDQNDLQIALNALNSDHSGL
jgi:ATP-dependent Lon protease